MREQDKLFFKESEGKSVTTPFGEVIFPLQYYDTRSIGGYYIVASDKLRRILPHLSIKPLTIYPGSSLLAVFASQHRNTSIGTYNSFTLGFPIRYPPKFAMPGWAPLSQAIANHYTTFIYHRFLDNSKAIYIHEQIFGESVTNAKIHFDDQGIFIHIEVTINSKHILTLHAEKLPLSHQTPIERHTYAMQNEKLKHALKRCVAYYYGSSLWKSDNNLMFGEHPAIQDLKTNFPAPKPISSYYVNKLIAKQYMPDKTWNLNTRVLLDSPK